MASVQTTMEESNSKRQKVALEEEDRISSLPDDVLNHILSCLPTKFAVATGRLSRRWRHLWQHLHVLAFYDDSLRIDMPIEQRPRFVVLVNSVLALLRNPRGVRKMRLDCAHSFTNDDNFRAHSVDTWIRAVIGPHLEVLDLDLLSGDDFGCDFKLPLSLFTCPNLVSLRIYGGIHLNVQSNTTISLPSLKMLLIDIGTTEVPFVNALLCGCPNIEALDLSFLTNSLEIVCLPPTLKRLKINIQYEDAIVIEINAPNLEYLNITHYIFSNVLNMNNLHNVVEASLHLDPLSFGIVVPLLNLLSALSRTKHLVLGGSTTKWLLGEPRDLVFQEFRYLLRLELSFPWLLDSNSLLSLLHKCPILQSLIIQNYAYKEESPVLRWAPQPSVPNCLVSHLTFIKFTRFEGFSDEVTFVEHVLQKGLVLKTMLITDISLDQSKKYDILKRLSNVPRASAMCRLTFD